MANLPSIAVLSKRSTKALIRTLRRFGITLDTEAVDAQVEAVLTQAATAEAASAALLAKVEASAVRVARLAMIRNIKDYVRREQRTELGLGGPSQRKAVWLAVLDSRTCPDCMARHGVRKTMAEWERSGLPGSDNLVCDGNCRCDLLREDMVESGDTRGEIRVSVDIEVSE